MEQTNLQHSIRQSPSTIVCVCVCVCVCMWGGYLPVTSHYGKELAIWGEGQLQWHCLVLWVRVERGQEGHKVTRDKWVGGEVGHAYAPSQTRRGLCPISPQRSHTWGTCIPAMVQSSTPPFHDCRLTPPHRTASCTVRGNIMHCQLYCEGQYYALPVIV